MSRVNAKGRYTIYLGANHANGVPMDLFASGEARWLGVQPEGQAEQARVQLVSVPYAMTAGDAQTLGGQPLSAFVLASSATGSATTASSAATTAAASGGIVALGHAADRRQRDHLRRHDQLPGEIHRHDGRHRKLDDLRHQHGAGMGSYTPGIAWASGRRLRRRPCTWSRRARRRGLWMSTATR